MLGRGSLATPPKYKTWCEKLASSVMLEELKIEGLCIFWGNNVCQGFIVAVEDVHLEVIVSGQ